MKNLFNSISQEEKNRILEMHSGKKNVISEQAIPTPKTPITGLLRKKGFVFQKYSGDFVYESDKSYSIFITPKNNSYEVMVVLGDPAEDLTKKGWTQQKGNLNDHPIYKMEKILNSKIINDNVGNTLQINGKNISDEQIKQLISQHDRLIPYIGSGKINVYR